MENKKKCIVLDLDNTLWGGVVGEDGKDGIVLSMSDVGSGFISFQQALRDLYDRGIILAINSHNNPEDALEVIRTHPNMLLKENHFAAMKLGWGDKAEAMREISEELNIGLDSMVFLDDSPLQREAVRSAHPEVAVPEMPTDPALYTKMLLSLPYFESNTVTDEDLMRGNFYVTERLRNEAQKRFENREAFLQSLSLQLKVLRNDTPALSRVSQLTEKTNQFNTNKVPKTPEEIGAYMQGANTEVFSAQASDRFGDHGIIAVAIVTKEKKNWNVETLLMSCRVFERGIEAAFVHAIASAAKDDGAETLYFKFEQTEKNEPARLFLEKYAPTGKILTDNIQSPYWITLS